ncbi:hypothetical protein V6N13_015045 [Hibiscus sabdariffa]|uniref:Uncharacterized protein n=1 Tax=Hibiscus sabdariffa TaxID=183260 RepID=A0ABR2RXB3_9ROSI
MAIPNADGLSIADEREHTTKGRPHDVVVIDDVPISVERPVFLIPLGLQSESKRGRVEDVLMVSMDSGGMHDMVAVGSGEVQDQLGSQGTATTVPSFKDKFMGDW